VQELFFILQSNMDYHFWATVYKMVHPMLLGCCPICLSCLSVTLTYCGQTAGWIKVPLGMEVGLGLGDIVLDGDPAPPQKGVQQLPTFRPMYCGQTAGWIKMTLGTEVGLGQGHIVLDGHPSPHAQKRATAASPNFRAMSVLTKRLDGSRCHLVCS